MASEMNTRLLLGAQVMRAKPATRGFIRFEDSIVAVTVSRLGLDASGAAISINCRSLGGMPNSLVCTMHSEHDSTVCVRVVYVKL